MALTDYKYIIFIAILLVVVYVVYTLVAKKSGPSSSSPLTKVQNANVSVTIPQTDISKINNNIAMANYSISIWQYIDAWSDTSYLKSIVNIPNVMKLSMGEAKNDLVLTLYGTKAGASSSTSGASDAGASGSGITDLSRALGKASIPNSAGGSPVTISMAGLKANTVYQYNNTYIFVYSTYADNAKTKWGAVMVGFSRSNPTQDVTYIDIARGGTTNSLLIEQTGSSVNNPGLVQFSACPKWNWSCNPRPTTDTCDQGTTVELCPPTISTPLVTPYLTSTDGTLSAAIFTITNKNGNAYFPTNQSFTFFYYNNQAPSPTATVFGGSVQKYNIVEGIVGLYDVELNTEPKALQTQSSLLDLSDTNNIDSATIITEPLTGSITSEVTYRIPNMPLQTWTHLLINVGGIGGVNVTMYINGQVRTAYILDFVPTPMNSLIQVTPAPSFTGWTSNLRYIPYGVSAAEAQQIYSKGYMGQTSSGASGLLSFFNRYSLKVIFVDNLGK